MTDSATLVAIHHAVQEHVAFLQEREGVERGTVLEFFVGFSVASIDSDDQVRYVTSYATDCTTPQSTLGLATLSVDAMYEDLMYDEEE